MTIIIHSRNLMGYVDGTLTPSSPLLPNTNEVNPAYTSWIRQDQMIVSWIISTLTKPVFAQIIG